MQPGAMRKPGRARRGVQSEPRLPLPPQHLAKPGLESKLQPRPRFLAPNYRAAGKLEGKVAIITGGDSGIGRAVAVLFAREGADVAINYLPAEESDARETMATIEALGRRCLLLPGDLRTAAVCSRVVASTVSNLGALNILVSNAAWQNHKDSILDVTDAEFDRTFKTNIYA